MSRDRGVREAPAAVRCPTCGLIVPAHGTYKGWRRHRYLAQNPCEPCRQAKNLYERERRNIRKARARAGLT